MCLALARTTNDKKNTCWARRQRATITPEPPPRHAPPRAPARHDASAGVVGVGVEARRLSPHVGAGVEARRAPWGGGRRGGPNPARERTAQPHSATATTYREGGRCQRERVGGGGRDYQIWGRERERSRRTHRDLPCHGGEPATPPMGVGRATEEIRPHHPLGSAVPQRRAAPHHRAGCAAP
jgi:hypothetical protein